MRIPVKHCCGYWTRQVVTETAFSKLKIPNSTPLVYNFRNSDALDAFPGGLKVIPYQNQQGSELRHELRGQWMDVCNYGATEWSGGKPLMVSTL
jgi:hypothetical protein